MIMQAFALLASSRQIRQVRQVGSPLRDEHVETLEHIGDTLGAQRGSKQHETAVIHILLDLLTRPFV